MRTLFTRGRLYLLASVLILASALGVMQYRAMAGPAQPSEAFRAAYITADGHIQKAVLLEDGTFTMANTTPVNGTVACIQGDAKQFAAQLTLSGTMAGTAPTLDVVLQHSIDYNPADPNAAHWITLKDFTDFNATVTPASQYDSWSDIAASTAVTFGDCYRARYTFGGTSSSVNIGLHLIAK